MEAPPATLGGQECPVCKEKKLTLMEAVRDVPYFGKVFIFSMSCSACNYHKADLETEEMNEPVKYTLEVETDEDMKIRIVKSSQATIKIPHVTTITPGPASNGYVTNVEGVLQKVMHEIKTLRDSEEDKNARKKAKNLIKKLEKVMHGEQKLKIIIEDPSGNSAIISDKAVKSKLNV